ncbi:hypothetical protein HDU76_007020, partial [Blyttiomyces sp. JEL0837]
MRILINCTGFGPFQGVAENPTTWLMENMNKFKPDNDNTDIEVKLLNHTVFETSAVGSVEVLKGLAEECQEVRREGDVVVWIHFGVNAGATFINLEQQAYNEATFGVGDERGWTPFQQPIDVNNPD